MIQNNTRQHKHHDNNTNNNKSDDNNENKDLDDDLNANGSCGEDIEVHADDLEENGGEKERGQAELESLEIRKKAPSLKSRRPPTGYGRHSVVQKKDNVKISNSNSNNNDGTPIYDLPLKNKNNSSNQKKVILIFSCRFAFVVL